MAKTRRKKFTTMYGAKKAGTKADKFAGLKKRVAARTKKRAY